MLCPIFKLCLWFIKSYSTASAVTGSTYISTIIAEVLEFRRPIQIKMLNSKYAVIPTAPWCRLKGLLLMFFAHFRGIFKKHHCFSHTKNGTLGVQKMICKTLLQQPWRQRGFSFLLRIFDRKIHASWKWRISINQSVKICYISLMWVLNCVRCILGELNWKLPKLKVAKFESCQNWKLPKLKIAKIENCQNWKLPEMKVAKLKVAKLLY